MKTFVLIASALLSLNLLGAAVAQQGVDPAYLRQYYQQLQQQQPTGDATPIYEQNAEQAQHYANPVGQQFRVKDNVQDQIRAQQQQQQQHQQQQQQQQQQSYVAPVVREYLQKQPNHAQPIQYQTQPQQAVYRHQPQQQQRPYKPSKLKAQLHEEEEEPDYEDQNSSYQFGFDVKDDEFTNYQNRKEVRDGAVIKGSYSVVDSDGFIRTVKYTADPKEGFKAEVIREPTDIVVKIPTPQPQHQQLLRVSNKQQQQHHQQQQQQQQPQHQYHQYQ